jgi:hypothetical protein
MVSVCSWEPGRWVDGLNEREGCVCWVGGWTGPDWFVYLTDGHAGTSDYSVAEESACPPYQPVNRRQVARNTMILPHGAPTC